MHLELTLTIATPTVLAPKYDIDFAAPDGPNPPVDAGSVAAFQDDVPKFLEEPTVQAKLAAAKKLSDVNVADYDAVFYPGGHGPVLDLPTDPVNVKLASDFFRAGKVTAAVCHGPAALVGATDANGDSIFKGRRATAFSDAEEEAVDKVKVGATEGVQRPCVWLSVGIWVGRPFLGRGTHQGAGRHVREGRRAVGSECMFSFKGIVDTHRAVLGIRPASSWMVF